MNARFAKLSNHGRVRMPDAMIEAQMKPTRVLIRERRDFIRDRYGHGRYAMHSGRITYVAHGKGYVMARFPGCVPFVLSEKEWLGFPIWNGQSVEGKK